MINRQPGNRYGHVPVLLKSNVIEITEVKIRSNGAVFKNLKVGSRIILSIETLAPGSSSNGTYSARLKITNIDTNESTLCTFNEIGKRLSRFVYKEIINGDRLLDHPIPSADTTHCGDCPYLHPYGEENDFTAHCELTGKDLTWHDYWLCTECCPSYHKD